MATTKQKKQSARLLERRIDPRAKILGFLEIARVNLVAAGLGAERGSPELDRARRATARVMRTVQGLNRASFWSSVSATCIKRSQTADELRDERSELLRDAREQLLGRDVTRAQIVGVVDTLHEVVRNMNNIFSIAKFKGHDEADDSWALDRFMCGALLPALAQGLDDFWQGLRETPDGQGISS